MAFVQKSALATGTTTVTPVLTGTVAGNILWAFVTGNQASALGSFTCSDGAWSQIAAAATATTIVRAEIWSKIAVGSDTMPQWGNNSTLMDCSVVEWSGQTTLDKTGTDTGVVSPETVTAAGTDGGTGRVIIVLAAERQTAAATETFTWNVNSLGVGTGINTINNSGGNSQAKHSNSIYVTTATTGSSADNGVATWNNVSTGAALVLASYYQGAIAISGSIGASGGVSAVNKQVMANAAAIGASAGVAVPAVGPSVTPTRVQAFGNNQGSGTTLTAVATVTAGNILLAVGIASTTPSISDTKSLTWTPLSASGGLGTENAWISSVIGSTGSDTVTLSGSILAASLVVLEVTGQNATPIDVQVANHGTGSASVNTGATGSPASANELAVGMVTATAPITARAFSPSLTSQSDETVQANAAISDGPLASASAETFTATCTSSNWSAWLALIQGAGGTGQTGNYETAALNGTIGANGTVTGTIPPQSTAIIGAISANGAVAGLNKEAAAVVAAITSNASVAGLNTESVQVAGSIGANGSVAGTDTTVTTLVGSIAANGAMAAVDTKAIALSGAIGANGALAGVPTETAPLIGAIAANGALSGTAVNTLLAIGAINANAGMAATNTGAVALNGVIAANGAVAGNLTKTAPLAGSISANGGMAGLNTVAAQLHAALAASAAMQAGNAQAVALLGLIAANGAVQGTITFPTQPLVGVIGAMGGMGGLLTSSFNVGVFTTALLWVTSCNGALEVGGRDGILALTGADGNVRVNGRDGLLNVTSADGPVRTQEVH